MTGDRLTVGVVTPHAADGPEVELPAMTGGRVATVMSRTRSSPEASPAPTGTAPTAHAELRASTEPAALDRAAVAFSGRTLTAVAHASTTSSYVIGHREEAAMIERLSQRFDVPAVASCAATAAALRAHGAGQVQLVHPPWFDEEFDNLGVAYFRSQGFDAVATRAAGLPDDPARVDPHTGQYVNDVERPVSMDDETQQAPAPTSVVRGSRQARGETPRGGGMSRLIGRSRTCRANSRPP